MRACRLRVAPGGSGSAPGDAEWLAGQHQPVAAAGATGDGRVGTNVRCLHAVTVSVLAGDHRRPPAAAPPGPVTACGSRRPPDRPAALRRRAAPADHLPARARRSAVAARRRAVLGSGHAVHHPGPLRHPAAACQRDRAGRARCGPRPAERGAVPGGVAAAVLALARLPRHAGAVVARGRAHGHLRGGPDAVGRDGGRDLRPDLRAAGHRRLSPSRALRAVRDHGPGDHGRPQQRPVRARRTRRRPGLVGPGHPDVPPGSLSRARPARLGGRGGRAGQGR